MKKITASIIIPTKNTGPRFKTVLDKIFSQSFEDFEVIVIDSGSTDVTIDLVRHYPAKLVHIKPEDFGHGKTRNFGATLAQGDVVVFLTQDAEPFDNNWLNQLLTPFNFPKIAGVYGRQVPKDNEKELDKYFFLSLYGDKDIIWTKNNSTQGDNVFSDANSAIRKEFLLNHPYKNDIIVSEDYEWALRMMDQGHAIFYNTDAKVIHSHSYNLLTLFKRNFDVGVSYKDIYKSSQQSTFLKKGLRIYKKEIEHLLKSKKPHLIPSATLRDFIRFTAVSIGKKEHLFPKKIKEKYLSAQRWYWI